MWLNFIYWYRFKLLDIYILIFQLYAWLDQYLHSVSWLLLINLLCLIEYSLRCTGTLHILVRILVRILVHILVRRISGILIILIIEVLVLLLALWIFAHIVNLLIYLIFQLLSSGILHILTCVIHSLLEALGHSLSYSLCIFWCGFFFYVNEYSECCIF